MLRLNRGLSWSVIVLFLSAKGTGFQAMAAGVRRVETLGRSRRRQ